MAEKRWCRRPAGARALLWLAAALSIAACGRPQEPKLPYCDEIQPGATAPGAAAPAQPAPGDPAAAPIRLPRVVPQVGHTARIHKVRYTADGAQLVSVSETVKIWDTRTGLLVGTLALPGELLLDFALHPDGRRIVTGSAEGHVTVWDLNTGEAEQHFKISDFAGVVALDSGGQRIAVGSKGSAAVVELATGKILSQVRTANRPASAVAFSPGGAVVVFQRADHMDVWDIEKRHRKFIIRAEAGPSKARFVGHGRLLVVGLHGTKAVGYAQATRQPFHVLVFDMATGKQLHELTGLDRAITDADLSPDGRMLGLTAWQTFHRFDLQTERRVDKLNLYPRHLISGTFAPQGGEFALASKPMNSRSPAVLTYDARTNKLRRTFEGTRWIPRSAAFSGDSRLALIGSLNESLTLWNVETGAAIRDFVPDDDWSQHDVAMSHDGTRAIAASVGKVRLWDLRTGRFRNRKIGTLWVYDVDMTPDGRRAAACGHGGELKVWDVDTGRTRAHIKSGDRNAAMILSAALTPDGQAVLWVQNGKMRLSHAETGALLREFETQGRVISAVLSPDGRQIATRGHDGAHHPQLKLWRIDHPKPVSQLSVDVRRAWELAFTPDGTKLLMVDGTAPVRIYDVRTTRLVGKLSATSGPPNNVAVAPDGRRVLTTSSDGSARLWDLSTGRSMAMISAQGQWLIYDEQGLFDASRRGGELVALVQDRRPYRIDQLAVRYNRPGVMLRELGLGAGGLWQHLEAQHRRRLRRMGLAEGRLEQTFAGAPTARIIDLQQRAGTAQLTFEVQSARGALAGYNVHVNDVPLFGLRGKPARGASGRFTEQVALTPGTNRIEVSATNAAGIESFRDLRTVTSQPAQPRDLYVLAFGVSRYANPKYNLGYAHKDALDLVAVAQAMEGKVFGRVVAHAFVDQEVTVPQLRAAKQLLAPARPNDVLVVFVAGHGLYTNDADAEYYYLTHEADVKRLRQTAAPFELVEDLVQEVAPRHKLLLIDTCTSGDRDPAALTPTVSAAGTRGLTPRTVRALVLDSQGPSRRAERSFVFERDRFIYNDLLRRSGAIVFSSSRGSELSFETEAAQNGVFTEEILRALTSPVADSDRNGLVSTDELRKYVIQAVAKETGEQQHPAVDHDNPTAEFGLPVVAQAASVLTRPDPAPQGAPPGARGLELVDDEPQQSSAGGVPCVPRTPAPPGCSCRAVGTGTVGSSNPVLLLGLCLVVLLARLRDRSEERAAGAASCPGAACCPEEAWAAAHQDRRAACPVGACPDRPGRRGDHPSRPSSARTGPGRSSASSSCSAPARRSRSASAPSGTWAIPGRGPCRAWSPSSRTPLGRP